MSSITVIGGTGYAGSAIEGAALFVVGGFSSLRPAAGAPRFVLDLSHAPAELHDELVAVWPDGGEALTGYRKYLTAQPHTS